MTLQVQIADVPDREDVVAEIWDDDSMVAEVRRSEHTKFLVELYPNPRRKSWSFNLDDWLRALEDARRLL